VDPDSAFSSESGTGYRSGSRVFMTKNKIKIFFDKKLLFT
jgi:hypothetical protein